MIGSLYAIVMGPTTLDVPQEPLGFETFNILFFIIGIAMIFGAFILLNFFNNTTNIISNILPFRTI